MRKRVFLALLSAVSMLSVSAAERLTSPDGNIVVVVDVQDGKPTYEVQLGGVTFLQPSPLTTATSVSPPRIFLG